MVRQALRDGIGRVAGAPALLAGVYLATLLLAAPLALALHGTIESHLGASVAADRVAEGVHWSWWEEFQAQAEGIERTFAPSIIGFAAPLANLSALADGNGPPAALLALVALYIAVWAFLIGGILDRLARCRRVTAAEFFSACGVHFFRFCRLAVVAGVAYWALFGLLHGWLFDDLYGAATRDVTVERTAFLIRIALYLLFAAVLLPVNMLFDYVKIRIVVEDRRSVIGALLAAGRFVQRRPGATLGLYLLTSLLFVLVLAVYAAVAPGASGGGGWVWLTLIAGQAYIVARLAVKLAFYAAQTAYFQSQLAHAGYVAAARPVWPDSPAAEAITASAPREAS